MTPNTQSWSAPILSGSEAAPDLQFAVLCDLDGVVREWLRDDIKVAARSELPRGFVSLLHESNHEKGLEFLAQLKQSRIAVDWDMCFPVNNSVKLLRVAGCRTDEATLVLGGESALKLASLCEEVGQSNPDLVPACESIATELGSEPRPDDDVSIYEQLMRMYNEYARLQRDYASQNAQLKRLADEKDRIMNMAVHDLRSPLNAISIMASSLTELASDRLTDPETEVLERIVHTAQEMGQSLTVLLDSARHNLGEPQLLLVEGDFARLVKERIRLLDALAARKNIRIEFDCEHELPAIAYDAVQMQHVVDNVVGNAIKYSPPGQQIDVRLDGAGKYLRLRVRDRGTGIPSSEITQIFRPFEIGTTEPTGGEVSNGLGLAICHSVMSAHDGSITAANHAEGGAEFTVLIPSPGTLPRDRD